MTSADIIVQWMIEEGLPLTRETWIALNWWCTPPAVLSAEEEAEVPWWLPSEAATRSRGSWIPARRVMRGARR
jgi:hypothetical protein